MPVQTSCPSLVIDVVTIFPEMFTAWRGAGVVGKAVESGRVAVRAHDLRAWSQDKHRKTDDYPFGGGAGMVMCPEPLFAAVDSLCAGDSTVILMSPRGPVLTQSMARSLAARKHLILLCGRYEGVDERVHEHLVDLEISIGDYILSGGELAAMVVAEATMRLLPGVLGDAESLEQDSFAPGHGMLGWPQYTRPREYRGLAVPDVLLSGNHAQIAAWRREQARELTGRLRPDLLREPAAHEE
ncbi:MAG: tRNA (guanosine(37)-N1)-methyltransferase TrmD [Candidatus Schekmanbacteria bacterium]|nr:tRNA (guanosine(37)-N1)-methyltransferase TrmD [Candidatus Schekmanbacteria bacterium]